MWTDPRHYYLTEVLGLRLTQSKGQPLDQTPGLPSNHTAPQGSPQIFITSKTELSLGARQLIEKMLSAIGITEFQLHEGQPTENVTIIAFGEPTGGIAADLQLPAWEEFFPPYEIAGIQELKKDTWEKLKKFKAEKLT